MCDLQRWQGVSASPGLPQRRVHGEGVCGGFEDTNDHANAHTTAAAAAGMAHDSTYKDELFYHMQ